MIDLTDSLGEKKAAVQPAKQGEVLCSSPMALKISRDGSFLTVCSIQLHLKSQQWECWAPAVGKRVLSSIQKLAVRQVGKGL